MTQGGWKGPVKHTAGPEPGPRLLLITMAMELPGRIKFAHSDHRVRTIFCAVICASER